MIEVQKALIKDYETVLEILAKHYGPNTMIMLYLSVKYVEAKAMLEGMEK